jgi:hypothetical protein
LAATGSFETSLFHTFEAGKIGHGGELAGARVAAAVATGVAIGVAIGPGGEPGGEPPP